MSEHEHSDTNATHHQQSDPLLANDLSGWGHDGAGGAAGDRGLGRSTRRSHFPKDDRRSSARLTEREQNERWPLG